jgi:hypothetical protein
MEFTSTVKPWNDIFQKTFLPSDRQLVAASIEKAGETEVAVARFMHTQAGLRGSTGSASVLLRERGRASDDGLTEYDINTALFGVVIVAVAATASAAGFTDHSFAGVVWGFFSSIVGTVALCAFLSDRIPRSLRARRAAKEDKGYLDALPVGDDIADSVVKSNQAIVVGTKGLHYLHDFVHRSNSVSFIPYEEILYLRHSRYSGLDFLVIGCKDRVYAIPTSYDELGHFLLLVKAFTNLVIVPPLPAELSFALKLPTKTAS